MNAKTKTAKPEPKTQAQESRALQIKTGLRAGTWLLTTAGQ